MSPEAWIILSIAAGVALAIYLVVRAPRHSPEMVEATERLGASAENVVAKANALAEENAKLRAERDAALAAKASQFETWQAEATNLRADVAALEERLALTAADAARTESGLTKALDDEQTDAEKLREIILRQDAELALLRPIADSAEKLLDDEKLPGEWAPVRAAIRARKEAGNG